MNNDKPAAAKLVLSRETLKNLKVRSGVRTGSGDTQVSFECQTFACPKLNLKTLFNCH